ncbi:MULTISPECIES: 2-keto-3-deoxy-L-rhamnonate dehydrogenase [Haloferax]|uniref:Sorbitol dehydrogenase (L-iditol 2-dehydrogenase) n=4 Tax=Haloferax TaxID=2251 RepID=M0IHQ6_HALVO|nr:MULTISPECIES: 2-keto-3-deoxy-L-rhamnonate dehydrogenase [Haloferax]ELZ78978.1 sorbitol dehydrogenase (L-iditol 2-dehydrogenase) [Haloferax lucentense DSM 14919]ELZ95552.1 sorbitol dehydrogenase (L-iditol 2-dehydrogenase) [Haloferax alexandrinus JCM 10717]MBC9988340.1 alcohol dehydrogenase [Haloferax sp. AS1]QIB77826.1 alcohol dehydrogenase catalytic domain-containing protein [Haloferax alexandrinus]RDZ30958.1 alcohol dehydrogenase [Haloferax sp. Atlit-48N]
MKAIIQTGPRSVETQEREVPTPDADELLIKVHTAGLCGSDAHAYKYDGGYEWIPIPRIMGHEYSGTVTEVGANVETFEVGDKVVEEPIHDCGHCFQCRNGQPNVCQNFSITGMHRDGAYTEYVTVTPEHVHAVPEGVPLRHAAITEPTSIATRAVLDQSVTTPGDNVLVEGPGPIGVLVAAVADSLGANVVVSGLGQDAAYRLPLLEDLGIDTVNLEEEGGLDGRVESQTDGIGFDVVFDATGHHSGVVSGNDVVRKGGQIVVVGIPNSASELSLTSTVRGEVDINTSYGSTWTNFEQALRLMERGEIAVEKILDTSYSVDDPAAAFEAFLGSETCKPVFQFDG